MSLSDQSWVGNDWRNMMIDCTRGRIPPAVQGQFGSHRIRAGARPAGGRESAGTKKDAHLEIHLAELVGPADQEREAHIQVELGKGVAAFGLRGKERSGRVSSSRHAQHRLRRFLPPESTRAGDPPERTHEVRIPHADNVLDAQLAHEEAVHPSERELDELDALLLQMRGKRRCVSGRVGRVRTPFTREKCQFRSLVRSPTD